MSLVAIGSTIRFASVKLINQNDLKIAVNLVKSRNLSSTAVISTTIFNRNNRINHSKMTLKRCPSGSLLMYNNNVRLMSTSLTTSQKHGICSQEVTKNLLLFTEDRISVEKDPKTLRLKTQREKPLVLILSWLQAKQKHLKKFAELYTNQGYDVVVAQITPWQLLWPVKGTQVVATEIVKFLSNNEAYTPTIIHGFSVGGYLWGECMVQMARDINKYQRLLDGFSAQIWDSAADITEIPVGVPKALFPYNPRLQSALKSYMLYHLKTFHDVATIHYMRSSQIFHYSLVTAPALFFVSKTDPVGAVESNHNVREGLESKGISVTWKCWDKSPHVGHFHKHREEYIEYLFNHLKSANLLRYPEKLRAKL